MGAADSKIWEEVPELAEALLDLARRRSAGSRARIASKRPKVKDCIEELTQMMQNAGLSQFLFYVRCLFSINVIHKAKRILKIPSKRENDRRNS